MAFTAFVIPAEFNFILLRPTIIDIFDITQHQHLNDPPPVPLVEMSPRTVVAAAAPASVISIVEYFTVGFVELLTFIGYLPNSFTECLRRHFPILQLLVELRLLILKLKPCSSSALVAL